jgi:hypothetical protein
MPTKMPGRADGDAVRAQPCGQVLARDLRHGVEHERLADRDQDLPGQDPAEGPR